ncbi:hypothetical protein BGZ72_008488 [Mortierella alpina]|nr:hypothetical protein BGZ72_008488 [Mortierella alpina]
MKRRLHAEASQKDNRSLNGLTRLPNADEEKADGYPNASASLWPVGVNARESYESGADGIDGRVLRKMKRIKLDSESPPAEPSDSLNNPMSRLDVTRSALYETPHYVPDQSIYEQHLRAARADQIRMLGPIRISTKSTDSNEALPNATSTDTSNVMYNMYSQDSDAAVYHGMNHLLHQMHATRKSSAVGSQPGDASLATTATTAGSKWTSTHTLHGQYCMASDTKDYS